MSTVQQPKKSATAKSNMVVIKATEFPSSVADVCAIVRDARSATTPVYPIGGGTSLDFGVSPRSDGIGMRLTKLNRVIDYPAADMTITVETGITMSDLRDRLTANHQQLPLDVPSMDEATLGGVLATDFSGPRRFGYGTARDYVIGIRAVDGRGDEFSGGGRVVKNVAGYDFCKLLIGSLGTLGVITEVTLKVKPISSARAALVIAPHNLEHLETLLARLPQSKTQPMAIEWLLGPAWRSIAEQQDWPAAGTAGWLLIGVEGTDVEVEWMIRALGDEVKQPVPVPSLKLQGDHYDAILSELREFPATSTAPLVIKAGVRPSRVVGFVSVVRKQIEQTASTDERFSVQAHAGSGIIRAIFDEESAAELCGAVIGKIHPLVTDQKGHFIVMRNSLNAMTKQGVWGPTSAPLALMTRVKRNFDPDNILNPNRFVF